MASGQWWNIWTLASPQAEEIVPHTIQSASKPQQGGKSQWGEIYTVAGPYATKADAQKAIGQYHGPPPGSTGPKDKPPVGVGNVLTGLTAIGDFFQRLGQANTWIRVGQVLLGLILIAAGVARITHVIPAATRLATAVGTKGLA